MVDSRRGRAGDCRRRLRALVDHAQPRRRTGCHPATASAPATSGGAAPAATPLPPLEAMDPFLRGLIGTLSSRPELARWLATEGLIQQMAVAIDRVSRGARLRRISRCWRQPRHSRSKAAAHAHHRSASFHRYDGIAGPSPASTRQRRRMSTARSATAERGLHRPRPHELRSRRGGGAGAQGADQHRPPRAVRLNEGKGATWVLPTPPWNRSTRRRSNCSAWVPEPPQDHRHAQTTPAAPLPVTSTRSERQKTRLDILHAERDLLVLNKPAGLPTIPSAPDRGR